VTGRASEAAYVVEHYCARAGVEELETVASRLAAAADAVAARGHRVRLTSSILFPVDELCLHLFAAASALAVAEAAELAAITPERVLPASVWTPPLDHSRLSAKEH